MKRLLVLFCASTLLVGCSRAPDPAADVEPERSAEASSVSSEYFEFVGEDLVDVVIGGFSAKVPSTWTADESNNIYYMPEGCGNSAVSWQILDADSMDVVFADQMAESEFVSALNDGIFEGSASASEMDRGKIAGIEERNFNMVGVKDGKITSYAFYLFDNPGGGILVTSLCNVGDSNYADAFSDYYKFLRTFEPADVPSSAAATAASGFEYSGPHLYSNAIVKDVMSGDRSQKLGEYSVSFANSEDCTDEALADWYLNYVKAHDFNYALIVYTDDEGYGIFETYGSIEIGDKIAQDNYGDYYTVDNSEARFITIESDGTVTDITDQ